MSTLVTNSVKAVGSAKNNIIFNSDGSITANGALYALGPAAAAVNAIADGATVTPDLSSNNNFTVTIAGNRTLANPTSPTVGQSGVIYIVQDATGSRTLSYGNVWRFQGNVAPTLSTSAGAVDMIVYAVRTTSNVACQMINNIG